MNAKVSACVGKIELLCDSTCIIFKAKLRGAESVLSKAKLQNIKKLHQNNISLVYIAKDLKKLAKKKLWGSILALSDI